MNKTLLPALSLLQLSQRITLYPELVTEKRFWLQLYNIERGVFTVYFYTLSGVLLFQTFLAHKEHYSTHTIWLPAKISTGIYKVAVFSSEHYYLKTVVIR
jgi:hypothetical protein